MRCRQVRANLGAFVDGETHSRLTEAIKEHLQHCSECLRARARLDGIGLLIQEMAVPPTPKTLAARILERAGRPTPSRYASLAKTPDGHWGTHSTSLRVAAAVLIAVGLSAGALMGRFVGGTTAAHPSPIQADGPDPAVVYNLDYLGGTQQGSLAAGYLALVGTGSPQGE